MKWLLLVLCIGLSGVLAACAQHPPGYDLAYMECEARASQITGPNGNILTQSYYIANCLKAKGYQP